MNVLIIGAGAIGSLVGAKLALQSHRVTLVGRSTYVEFVRTRGLQLEDETGTRQIDTLRAVGSVEEAYVDADAAFDLAVLTVKSYDTVDALEDFGAAFARHGRQSPPMLSLQNGVGNEESIASVLGGDRVIAGTITTPVAVPRAGTIRVERPKYVVGLSDWQPPTGASHSAALQPIFSRAGFSTQLYHDAQGMKWTKLLMNMLGNASSAILAAPPEAVFAQATMADLEIDAWREALAVMAADGITPQNLDSYPFRFLAPAIRHGPRALLRGVLQRQIGGARGGKMPSLYLDLESGKGKSEVGWLNGAVAARGRLTGIATPANQTLTTTLLTLVEHPEERQGWRHNYSRLAAAVAAQSVSDS